jgi:GNAT superfamily N-acetyltransferase
MTTDACVPVVPVPRAGTAPRAARRAGIQIRELGVGPTDRALVEELVLTCGPAALRARFFLPQEPDPRELLELYGQYLVPGPGSAAVLALADNRPVGLLNLVPTAPLQAEVAVLVAVERQRRGVGSALVRTALSDPRWAGGTVRAKVQHTNQAARALLHAAAPPHDRVSYAADCLEFDITIPIVRRDRHVRADVAGE